MTKPKLTYFDFSGSRGEECRLALHAAGVEFDDHRVKGPDWGALKATTPFGSMPVFEIPGKPPLAQSNAILTLIGRRHGLHPTDDFEAAQHEALMAYAEELRHHVSPQLRLKDDAAMAARAELATAYLPAWASNVERVLGDGPFVGGATLHVADLKLYIVVRWFATGTVDHIPATVFDPYPKLMRLYREVGAHPKVVSWMQQH